MTTQALKYHDVRGHIETLIDTGSSLQFVEDWIETLASIPEDARMGLNLYAWAWFESMPGNRRRLVTFVPGGYQG